MALFFNTKPQPPRRYDPYFARAVRMARDSASPYSRPLTDPEIEEKGLDPTITWYTDGRGRIFSEQAFLPAR